MPPKMECRKLFTCPSCNSSFVELYVSGKANCQKKHQFSSPGKHSYTCKQCNKPFEYKAELIVPDHLIDNCHRRRSYRIRTPHPTQSPNQDSLIDDSSLHASQLDVADNGVSQGRCIADTSGGDENDGTVPEQTSVLEKATESRYSGRLTAEMSARDKRGSPGSADHSASEKTVESGSESSVTTLDELITELSSRQEQTSAMERAADSSSDRHMITLDELEMDMSAIDHSNGRKENSALCKAGGSETERYMASLDGHNRKRSADRNVHEDKVHRQSNNEKISNDDPNETNNDAEDMMVSDKGVNDDGGRQMGSAELADNEVKKGSDKTAAFQRDGQESNNGGTTNSKTNASNVDGQTPAYKTTSDDDEVEGIVCNQVPDNDMHSCLVCAFKSAKPIDLIEHIRSKHMGSTSTVSRFFTFQCGEKMNLKRDAKSCRFKCPYCRQTLKLHHKMQYHIRTHTGGERPYQCKVCGCKVKQQSTMVRHIWTVHEVDAIKSCMSKEVLDDMTPVQSTEPDTVADIFQEREVHEDTSLKSTEDQVTVVDDKVHRWSNDEKINYDDPNETNNDAEDMVPSDEGVDNDGGRQIGSAELADDVVMIRGCDQTAASQRIGQHILKVHEAAAINICMTKVQGGTVAKRSTESDIEATISCDRNVHEDTHLISTEDPVGVVAGEVHGQSIDEKINSDDINDSNNDADDNKLTSSSKTVSDVEVVCTMSTTLEARNRNPGAANKEMHSCLMCDFKSTKSGNVVKHIHNQHKGTTSSVSELYTYQCGEKEKKMTLKRDAKSQLYKCPYCTKTSKQCPNMKFHIRTHTGEQPYWCRICDCKKKWQSTIVSHIWTAHEALAINLCMIKEVEEITPVKSTERDINATIITQDRTVEEVNPKSTKDPIKDNNYKLHGQIAKETFYGADLEKHKPRSIADLFTLKSVKFNVDFDQDPVTKKYICRHCLVESMTLLQAKLHGRHYRCKSCDFEAAEKPAMIEHIEKSHADVIQGCRTLGMGKEAASMINEADMIDVLNEPENSSLTREEARNEVAGKAAIDVPNELENGTLPSGEGTVDLARKSPIDVMKKSENGTLPSEEGTVGLARKSPIDVLKESENGTLPREDGTVDFARKSAIDVLKESENGTLPRKECTVDLARKSAIDVLKESENGTLRRKEGTVDLARKSPIEVSPLKTKVACFPKELGNKNLTRKDGREDLVRKAGSGGEGLKKKDKDKSRLLTGYLNVNSPGKKKCTRDVYDFTDTEIDDADSYNKTVVNKVRKAERKKSTNTQMMQAEASWVQCDLCSKWRKLPSAINIEEVADEDEWFCQMNADKGHNDCEIPEEAYDGKETAIYSDDGEKAADRFRVKFERAKMFYRKSADRIENTKQKTTRMVPRTKSPMRKGDGDTHCGSLAKARKSRAEGLAWCSNCGGLNVDGSCSGDCAKLTKKRVLNEDKACSGGDYSVKKQRTYSDTGARPSGGGINDVKYQRTLSENEEASGKNETKMRVEFEKAKIFHQKHVRGSNNTKQPSSRMVSKTRSPIRKEEKGGDILCVSAAKARKSQPEGLAWCSNCGGLTVDGLCSGACAKLTKKMVLNEDKACSGGDNSVKKQRTCNDTGKRSYGGVTVNVKNQTTLSEYEEASDNNLECQDKASNRVGGPSNTKRIAIGMVPKTQSPGSKEDKDGDALCISPAKARKLRSNSLAWCLNCHGLIIAGLCSGGCAKVARKRIPTEDKVLGSGEDISVKKRRTCSGTEDMTRAGDDVKKQRTCSETEEMPCAGGIIGAKYERTRSETRQSVNAGRCSVVGKRPIIAYGMEKKRGAGNITAVSDKEQSGAKKRKATHDVADVTGEEKCDIKRRNSDCSSGGDDIINLGHDYVIKYDQAEVDLSQKLKSTRSKQCPYCHKQFSKYTLVVRHSRMHTGTYPFVCLHCRHRCTQRPIMLAHIVNRHWARSKEAFAKMIKCCRKKAGEKCKVSNKWKPKHICKQSGNQPFYCVVCLIHFSYPSDAKQHIVMNHGKQLEGQVAELQGVEKSRQGRAMLDGKLDEEKLDDMLPKDVGECDGRNIASTIHTDNVTRAMLHELNSLGVRPSTSHEAANMLEGTLGMFEEEDDEKESNEDSEIEADVCRLDPVDAASSASHQDTHENIDIAPDPATNVANCGMSSSSFNDLNAKRLTRPETSDPKTATLRKLGEASGNEEIATEQNSDAITISAMYDGYEAPISIQDLGAKEYALLTSEQTSGAKERNQQEVEERKDDSYGNDDAFHRDITSGGVISNVEMCSKNVSSIYDAYLGDAEGSDIEANTKSTSKKVADGACAEVMPRTRCVNLSPKENSRNKREEFDDGNVREPVAFLKDTEQSSVHIKDESANVAIDVSESDETETSVHGYPDLKPLVVLLTDIMKTNGGVPLNCKMKAVDTDAEVDEHMTSDMALVAEDVTNMEMLGKSGGQNAAVTDLESTSSTEMVELDAPNDSEVSSDELGDEKSRLANLKINSTYYEDNKVHNDSADIYDSDGNRASGVSPEIAVKEELAQDEQPCSVKNKDNVIVGYEINQQQMENTTPSKEDILHGSDASGVSPEIVVKEELAQDKQPMHVKDLNDVNEHGMHTPDSDDGTGKTMHRPPHGLVEEQNGSKELPILSNQDSTSETNVNHSDVDPAAALQQVVEGRLPAPANFADASSSGSLNRMQNSAAMNDEVTRQKASPVNTLHHGRSDERGHMNQAVDTMNSLAFSSSQEVNPPVMLTTTGDRLCNIIPNQSTWMNLQTSASKKRSVDFVYAPSAREKLIWEEQIVQCPVCSIEEDSTKDLMRHVREHHSGETPFRCVQCMFSSATKETMVDHVNGLHPATCFDLCHFFHICQWQGNNSATPCNPSASGKNACRPLNSDSEFYHCSSCGFKSFQLPLMVNHVQKEHKKCSYLEVDLSSGEVFCPVCLHHWDNVQNAFYHTCSPTRRNVSFPYGEEPRSDHRNIDGRFSTTWNSEEDGSVFPYHTNNSNFVSSGQEEFQGTNKSTIPYLANCTPSVQQAFQGTQSFRQLPSSVNQPPTLPDVYTSPSPREIQERNSPDYASVSNLIRHSRERQRSGLSQDIVTDGFHHHSNESLHSSLTMAAPNWHTRERQNSGLSQDSIMNDSSEHSNNNSSTGYISMGTPNRYPRELQERRSSQYSCNAPTEYPSISSLNPHPSGSGNQGRYPSYPLPMQPWQQMDGRKRTSRAVGQAPGIPSCRTNQGSSPAVVTHLHQREDLNSTHNRHATEQSQGHKLTQRQSVPRNLQEKVDMLGCALKRNRCDDSTNLNSNMKRKVSGTSELNKKSGAEIGGHDKTAPTREVLPIIVNVRSLSTLSACDSWRKDFGGGSREK